MRIGKAEFERLAYCPYDENCCMKERGKCTALGEPEFKDGECHFRKLRPDGLNLYDYFKKRQKKLIDSYAEAEKAYQKYRDKIRTYGE